MTVPAYTRVENLGSAVRHSALDEIPGYLIKVVEGDIWREFTTKMGERARHESFESFVTTPPLAGIGTTVDMLRRCCGGDPAALDALDRVTAIKPGQHRQATSNRSSSRQGTTTEQALRRLRKDRPDLHQKVLAGELTANKAMITAGFRHPTATIPLDDPERIAATLRRRLTDNQLAQLRQALRQALS